MFSFWINYAAFCRMSLQRGCVALQLASHRHRTPPNHPDKTCFQSKFILFYQTLIFTFLNPSRLANWTGEKDATDNFCVNNTSHIWQFLLLLKVNTVLDESILSLRAAQEWANDILQKLKSGKFVKVCIWN